jgi:hypothetical protein
MAVCIAVAVPQHRQEINMTYDGTSTLGECKECHCKTGGGNYCYEHAPYTVWPKVDGSFHVDRNGRKHISYDEPPIHPTLEKLRALMQLMWDEVNHPEDALSSGGGSAAVNAHHDDSDFEHTPWAIKFDKLISEGERLPERTPDVQGM